MRLSIKTKQVVGVVLLVGARRDRAERDLHGARRRRAAHRDAVARRDADGVRLRARPARHHLARGRLRRAAAATAACARCSSRRWPTRATSPTRRWSIRATSSSSTARRCSKGQVLEPQAQLEPLLGEDPWTQIQAISSEGTFEVSERLLLGNEGENEFGTIRIGISTALIWEDLLETMRTAVLVGLAALAVSDAASRSSSRSGRCGPCTSCRAASRGSAAASSTSSWICRAGDEFSELGASFNKLSRRAVDGAIAAGDRSGGAGRIGGRSPRGRGGDGQPGRPGRVRQRRDPGGAARGRGRLEADGVAGSCIRIARSSSARWRRGSRSGRCRGG